MATEVSSTYKFDKCYICQDDANGINDGQPFQAVGHRCLGEQIEWIHAVCLPCIQREADIRCNRLLMNPSTLAMCELCTLPFTDPVAGEVGLQRQQFDVRPAPAMMNEDGKLVALSIVTAIETSEEVRSLEAIMRRSRIEIALETIGRELVGRAVSFVFMTVFATACVAPYTVPVGLINECSKPIGLRNQIILMLAFSAIAGVCIGLRVAMLNPFGPPMGMAGARIGRSIAIRLRVFNDQVQRVNRAWANLFVGAAQQPIG